MLMNLIGCLAKGGNSVNLSGSSGTPNSTSDLQVDPDNSESGWRFNSDGSIQRNLNGGYSAWNPTPDEWSARQPITAIGDNYWIRATLDAGSTPTAGTLNTWQQLSTNREWYISRPVVGVSTFTVKIEIATDSGGTNIIATGYYRGTAEVA